MKFNPIFNIEFNQMLQWQFFELLTIIESIIKINFTSLLFEMWVRQHIVYMACIFVHIMLNRIGLQ